MYALHFETNIFSMLSFIIVCCLQMDALDLIEQRINKLENVVGNIKSNSGNNEDTICDALSNVGSLLTTVASGHEKLDEMLKRCTKYILYFFQNYHQILILLLGLRNLIITWIRTSLIIISCWI